MLIPVPIHRVLRVLEVIDVVNKGSADQDVSLVLPKGYEDLQVEDKQRRAEVNNGKATFRKAAKANATTTISISFTLPFDARSGAQFTLHSTYDVDSAHIYLPTGDYALSAPGLLTTTQKTAVDGTDFRVFTRLGISVGDDWVIQLQHLPSATTGPSEHLPVIGAPMSERQNMLQASANLILAAVVLGIGLLGIRSAGRAHTAASSRREALVSALERIEMEFAAGRLAEDAYHQYKRDILQKIAETAQSDSGREGRG